MFRDFINNIKNHKPFSITSRYLKLSEPPKHYIGENKDLYTGCQEQRTWIKDHISKTMIYVDGEWQLHSISVGTEHPLFSEIKDMIDKYKEENSN